MRIRRFHILHPIVRVLVFLSRPSHVRGVSRLLLGGQFTEKYFGGPGRTRAPQQITWGLEGSEDLTSHKERLLGETTHTHIGLRQIGEPVRPPAPVSASHSWMGRESGDAHEPKGQSSEHVQGWRGSAA